MQKMHIKETQHLCEAKKPILFSSNESCILTIHVNQSHVPVHMPYPLEYSYSILSSYRRLLILTFHYRNIYVQLISTNNVVKP